MSEWLPDPDAWYPCRVKVVLSRTTGQSLNLKMAMKCSYRDGKCTGVSVRKVGQ